jgi:hypothetical protein
MGQVFVSHVRHHRPEPPVLETGWVRRRAMAAVQETVDKVKSVDVDAYKYGFVTDIESDMAPKGLNEDIVRFISAKKDEPEWMTQWRLDAYKRWLTMQEPVWARVNYPKIDFQDLYYYAAPKRSPGPKSLDEVAFPCANAKSSRGSKGRRSGAWLWTRSSTRFRSPPPSRRNWPRRA